MIDAPPPVRGTRHEILALTGLRALAAWWVVAFHFGQAHVGVPVLREVVASGHVAVDLFFVLSGFVLAHRSSASDLATSEERRAFYRRRFARVYPLYVASLGLGFFAEWPGSGHALTTGVGALRLFGQLALLNAFFHGWMFRLNWAAWSLSVEAFMYLLFPWILAWTARRSPRRLLLGCALAALVAPLLYTVLDPDHLGRPLIRGDEILWSWYLKFFPLQRLPMFVAGALAGLLARQEARQRLPRFIAELAVALVLGVVVSRVCPYAFLQGGALLLVFVALVASLAQGEATSSGWLGRSLASAPCVALGHASYATYILHVPLFLAFARFVPDMWESLPWFAVYLATLLALSLAAHRYVEEPARRAFTRPRLAGVPAAILCPSPR